MAGRVRWFIFVLMSALWVQANAVVVDMVGAIKAAEKYDAQYLRAQSVFEQSGYLDEEARAVLEPQLLLTHYQRVTDQEVVESKNAVYQGGDSNFDSRTSLLRLEQVLYDRQSWQWYLRAGVEQKVFAQNLRAEYQNLLLRLAESLLHREMAVADLRLATSDVEALARLALLQSKRFEQGEAARVDFLDAQAGLDNARARKSEAQQKLNEIQRRLEMIVGDRVVLARSLTDDWVAFDSLGTSEQWWQQALASSPQLLSAELRRQMAKLGHKSARSANKPKLYIGAEYNSDAKDDTLFGGGATVEGSSVYLRAHWDIYSGGASLRRAQRAAGELRTAELERELAERDVKQLLDLHLDKLSAGADQIRGYQSAVAAGNELAALRKGQLDAGTVDELKYFQALRSAVESQTRLVKAVGNYQLTALRLLHVAGVLTAQDLQTLQ